MENMKIPIMAITAAIVVIVIGSVLAPVISDATKTEDVYTNEGYFYLDRFTDEFSFKWDYDNPNVFTINDKNVNFTNTSGLDMSVVLGDTFLIRYYGDRCAFFFEPYWGSSVEANAINKTLDVTLSNGTLTGTNGLDTQSASSVTELYSITDNGPYIMKKTNESVYLKEDSQIFATGITEDPNAGAYLIWHMDGTPADETGFHWPDEFISTITVSDEAINITESATISGLYELSTITFKAEESSETGANIDITASYFVVPAKVAMSVSNPLGSGTIAILTAIPTLVIIALLVAAISIYNRSKLD